MVEIQTKQGFTIVELLVTIVVIVILASIAIISYNGFINDTYDASVKSDLHNMGKLLEIDRIKNSKYISNSGQLAQRMALLGFSIGDTSSYAIAPQTKTNVTVCFHLIGESIAVVSMSKSGKAFYVYSGDDFAQHELSPSEWAGDSSSERCQAISNDLSLVVPSTGNYNNYNGYSSTDTTTGPWRKWTGK